jgi:hypothetical protein
MKKLLVFVLIAFVAASLGAQSFAGSAGSPNAEDIGIDSAQQKLKEVSVSKFEDAGFWYASMPRDMGLVETRRFPGSPLDKQPIPDEEEAGIIDEDQYVLGARVSYLKRGVTYFELTPSRPLPIEGVTKTVSVWVVGRNVEHELHLIVSDFFGNRAEIYMGKLNFSGWKQLTVAIPPHIRQRDFRYGARSGLRVEGFRVDCDPEETLGSYYIYFDDLRAVTDLFGEESRDVDDIPDGW